VAVLSEAVPVLLSWEEVPLGEPLLQGAPPQEEAPLRVERKAALREEVPSWEEVLPRGEE